MRNIHLLEQFMKENGLEFDKPFRVKIKTPKGELNFDEIYIHKDDNRYIGFTLNYADNNELVEDNRLDILDLLFSDNVKIVKTPWKPKYGERYWYVWFDETHDGWVRSSSWDKHSADFTKYIIGNCFKTEEEAEEHVYDVLQILKGEPLIKYDK